MLCAMQVLNLGAAELWVNWCDISVFITYLASPAVLMKGSSRVVVQVLLLALVAQVAVCQHWSYGWLPGGKRSVGELEATIRVSDYFIRSFSYRKCAHFIKLKVKLNRNSSTDLLHAAWWYFFFLEKKKIISHPTNRNVSRLLLFYCLLLLLDDGHRRSGVSSWGGECPNPRET